MCSICGYINRELTLSQRTWTCPQCKSEHDRDVNASQNIK
ncbi:MAG: transposase [bacterium]|nr:transposase [bacterium]